MHRFLYVSRNFIGRINRLRFSQQKQKIIRRLSLVTPPRKAHGFPAPVVRNKLDVALTQALKVKSDSEQLWTRWTVFFSNPPFVL